jgi:hypothetical protein
MCKVFLWLAARNRCWTADRLANQGLQHPEHCIFCDQEEEIVQHILTSCVFSREFWFQVLALLGFLICVSSNCDLIFVNWWRRASK